MMEKRIFQRRIYLKMKGLSQAQRLFWERFSPQNLIKEELIASEEAAGRVTSRPVYARLSSPGYHSAAMDGMAVKAQDTFGAGDQTPITLKVPEQATPINTGQVLPSDKDAVIMIENVTFLSDSQIEIRSAVFPWQNVRKVGEDIVATELLFPTNHLLEPYDIGALITGGISTVYVWERPLVWIIPTGSELVTIEQALEEGLEGGRTIESNCAVLSAMVRKVGCKAHVTQIVPDDIDALKDAVIRGLDSGAHMVVINAGSSAGSRDYTAQIIEELGELIVHGVTIMPGKPTVLGQIDGRPVVGNPGYPVSSVISFEKLVIPLLYRLQRRPVPEATKVEAHLARSLPSKAGMREYRRAVIGIVGDRRIVMPIKKGAGSITTLTRANCILEIPASSEGLSEGQKVTVQLLRPQEDMSRTLICIGSHDLSLDLIKDRLMKMDTAYYMASTHVGSLGGIMAMKKRLAHVAGTHLLDPDTGLYNVTYVDKYLKDMDTVLITLAYRQQGLMVLPGNPKGIKGLVDLARSDVTFVNRQAGSGTRVLLDHHLEKVGIGPHEIQGYDNEEYTHMAVAISVLSGKADAGLGILAAARALGLDFIPVVQERYDLLLHRDMLETPLITALLNVIRSDEFQKALESLGGYDVRDTGVVVT